MEIYYDITSERSSRHISGLTRVSRRLLAELQALSDVEVRAVYWNTKKRRLLDAQSSGALMPRPAAYYVVPELFSEAERPGFLEFLESTPIYKLAIYHDAIPLKFPEFTWPRSVQRHPAYMKSLVLFDGVAAVSDQSRRELQGYWHWLGIDETPPIHRIALGADFMSNKQQEPASRPERRLQVLTVGILEPRKNQLLLLNTCERLWQEGHRFDLVIAGRTNPHYSKAILEKIRTLKKAGYPVDHRKAVTDDTLWSLYRDAYFTVFPSRHEGYGLPVQESLWAGTPCICADIPALCECARSGGCVEFRDNDSASLYAEMKRLLDDDACHERLCEEISKREFPTWRSAAIQLIATLSAKDATESLHDE